MGNRVFQGPAFVCRPGVIEFKDFTINKPHKKRIQLTNVSLAFNRFKVRPPPCAISHQYVSMLNPKGLTSALSSPIDVTCKLRYCCMNDAPKCRVLAVAGPAR